MKTEFIDIPVRAFRLDPQNKTQVAKLIEMADAKFRLSAKAWEEGNNSGDAEILARCTKRENRLAKEGEAMLSPLGIKTDWPGLHPSFKVNGYEEHSTEMAVIAALGHPRNWLNPAVSTEKTYRCQRCSHEVKQETNHYGQTYSWGKFNTCPNCPPWAKYPEFGGSTVWECMDKPSETEST